MLINKRTAMGILETVALILVILWVIGFALHVAGSLIHLLLVIAVILVAIRLARGPAQP